AGLVHAVHVAEGGGEHVAAAEAVEGFVHAEHVFGGGVELLSGGVFVADAVFFASDHAGFDLKDDLVLGTELHQLHGDLHVLFERKFGAVEHVAVEQVGQTGGAAAGGFRDE